MNPQSIAPLIHPLADAPGVNGVAVFDRTTCFLENMPQAFSRAIRAKTHKLFDTQSDTGTGNRVARGTPSVSGQARRPVFVDEGSASFLVAHFGSFAIAALLAERADRSRVTDVAMQVGGALLENEPAPKAGTVPSASSGSPSSASSPNSHQKAHRIPMIPMTPEALEAMEGIRQEVEESREQSRQAVQEDRNEDGHEDGNEDLLENVVENVGEEVSEKVLEEDQAAAQEEAVNDVVKDVVNDARKVTRVQVMRWADVKPMLVDALSQVIALPLAQGVVEREMRFENLQPGQMTYPAAVSTFCDRLLTQVPMKSRHDSVRAEIERRLGAM